MDEGRLWFGKKGDSRPRQKSYLSEADGVRSWSWWANEDVGHNQEAKKEINAIFSAKDAFATPKPERLIQRIISIATDENDIVFDAFLGSGTTAAVAHKMGRRWIGVEMGEQAKTHCARRLQKVIDGEKGGVSKDTRWEGGGGFRFCSLGPTIFDAGGKISDTVRFNDLSRHIWFAETKSPLNAKSEGTVIGIQGDKAYALLFNGVLKDRSAQGGNVLLRSTLQIIRDDVAKLDPDFDGDLVIYAASTAFGSSTLNREGIAFKQTPYDISAQG